MNTVVRIVSAVCTTFVLVAGLTACSEDEESGPPSITHEEANAEFFDEAAQWTLPEGWGWPDGPVYSGVGPDGARAVYGPDIGRVDATFYWFCAWTLTLIEATDGTEREHALEQVLRVRETPYFQVGLNGGGSVAERVDAAAAGDLRGLTDFAEANCTLDQW